ncbi:MAG: MFS transporter [Steroidobacteraceae bacterium]
MTTDVASPEPYPDPRRAWYGVGVFALMLLVLFGNSGIIGLLVDDIKRDLQLDDVKASLIIGFAASSLHAVLALPVSRLVDTLSRRLILGVGLVILGTSSLATGLAATFGTLFLARLLGGIGAAGSGPATYSILADYFPPAKLPRAVSFMNIGTVYGAALALLVGATLLVALRATPTLTLPLVGTVRSWQVIFMITAIPDFLLALLMLTTVLEPPRRGRPAATAATDATDAAGTVRPVPVREVFRFLWDGRAHFGPMFGGLLITSLAAGVLTWTPMFYVRTYGWTPAQYGFLQGIIGLVASPLGLLAGGYLAEWFARRGRDDANLRVVALGATLHLPFSIGMPLMPSPYLALTLGAVNGFIAYMGAGPQNAALQVLVPNHMRGQVTALFLFIFSMVGFGFSPTLVALLTNYVFHDESMLRYSMFAISGTLGPLGALVFWLGVRPYGKAFAQARAWH